jgi:multiple inositol-polyphosphate phosphatase / 2,3-bisphosphoglycerate 3-phosphatase
MKHNLLQVFISIIFILVSSILVMFKSDCNDVHWGTKTIYHPLQKEYAIQPEGYQPVFINYVGRHGARHLTSANADSLLFLVLKMAESEHALTKAGEKLKQMDSVLLLVEKGNFSLISELGKEEQQSIGERMRLHFNPVFSASDGSIKITTTKKERTKQSAKAFLTGLNPIAAHTLTTDYNDNDNLAFYDVAPAYKLFKESGNWKSSFERIENTPEAKQLAEELPKQFLTGSFINKLNSKVIQFSSEARNMTYTAKSFITGYYDACSIVASLVKEIAKAGYKLDELNFGSLVSCSVLQELDYINSAEEFLLKGPGIDANGIQVRIAVPLLISFLNSVDEFAASKKVIADLRFAHAETIAPFAALLGLEGASEPISAGDILNYNKVWKCENIIPLSSNIQWILYQNKTKEDFLVKFLLNEKEVAINGLKNSGTRYFYKWTDIKRFYYSKLESLHIHPGDNMHDYLLNVQ